MKFKQLSVIRTNLNIHSKSWFFNEISKKALIEEDVIRDVIDEHLVQGLEDEE
jgi:hypothetical protein